MAFDWLGRGPFQGAPSSRGELVSRARRILSLVGGTPMRCRRLGGVELCVKLEYANPTGSHKDRIAAYMLWGAAREGLLEPGGCVGEISSGNTAVSVAWASALLGVRAVLYIEGGASPLKEALVRALGGELVRIPRGPEGRRAAVEDMESRGCVYLEQSASEYNWLAHYETTGREVLEQTHWSLDAFVMGVGTGGTLTGVGARLREEVGSTLVAGVSPRGSRLLGGEGGDVIEGLASHDAPSLYQRHSRLVDRLVPVSSSEALRGVRALARATGILAGPSTGAALAGLSRLVGEGLLDRGSRALIIAADHATRYPGLLEGAARRPAGWGPLV